MTPWIAVQILLVFAGGLVISIGAMFVTKHGFLLLALTALWALAAGAIGAWLQSWWWVVACPAAMLGLVFLWETSYGPESWASMDVFMLGVVFTASALVGSIPGIWIGKRRQVAATTLSIDATEGTWDVT